MNDKTENMEAIDLETLSEVSGGSYAAACGFGAAAGAIAGSALGPGGFAGGAFAGCALGIGVRALDGAAR